MTVSPYGSPVTTDADGHYSVPDLLPGSYTVTFTPPAGSPLLGEAYDNAVPWNPTRFTVGSADVTGIDAVARPRRGSIAGRVVDADGDPIAGVSVQLQSAAFVYASATTGPDGTYVAAGLRPGDWRISFTAPQRLAVRLRVLRRRPHARDADRRLAAPATAATLHDAVLAARRHHLRPHPRARRDAATRHRGVRLDGGRRRRRRRHDRRRRRLRDHRAGRRRLHRVAPSRTGPPTSWASSTRERATGRTPSGCTSPAAPPSSSHDMTLIAGATITGTAFGPDGAPLANANVQADGRPDERERREHRQATARTRSTCCLPAPTASPSRRTSRRRSCGRSTPPSPGVTRSSQATPVVLAAGGAVEGIDLHAGREGLGGRDARRDGRAPARAGRALHHRRDGDRGPRCPDGFRLGGQHPRGRGLLRRRRRSTPRGTPR